MNGVTILMYHVIGEPLTSAERQWCCSVENFRGQMRWLKDNCNLVTLDDVVRSIESGRQLAARAVCVSFDDGTRCLLERALPILQEQCIPATAFVVSGLLGGYNDWLVAEGWSRRKLLDESDLMELRQGGVEIGSHSEFHADLSSARDEQLEREVWRSKSALEAVVGVPVRHFAYPYGRFSERTVAAVRRAGYVSACGVEPGRNTAAIDPMQLRRVEIFHRDSLREFALKVKLAVDHACPNLQCVRGVAKRLLESAGLRSPNRFSARAAGP